MSSSADAIDTPASARDPYTTVHPGEVLRHPARDRFLHWSVAIFFILALLSGFALFSPWLFKFLTPLFGGGPMTRFLHPWFSLGFCFFFILEAANWWSRLALTEGDKKWLRGVGGYIKHEEKLEPEDVGFFNGGQKIYAWTIFWSMFLFLVTGILMWFPEVFGRIAVYISYFLHDVAALVMLGGFIIHVYMSTAMEPGSFHSMVAGTVSERFAWTHHPAWYKEVTGREPRKAYEEAAKKKG
jgi:formate dehydrogenase subunit gamma